MLVHKVTLGVLVSYWNGEYRHDKFGNYVPTYKKYKIDGVLFTSDDYWYVPENSSLGKEILFNYPYFDPILNEDGDLVSINVWPNWKKYGEEEPVEIMADIGKTAKPIDISTKKRRRKQKGLKLGIM